MRLIAGTTPPEGQALGVYGSSKVRAFAAWVFVLLGLVNLVTGSLEHTGWTRVADGVWFVLWIVIAFVLTFTPKLAITSHDIRRRLRSPISWAEVVEILPPRALARDLRVRLDDRAVIELPEVTADRREALVSLLPVRTRML